MQQKTVTLLHISDIQFGRNHRFGNIGGQGAIGDEVDTLLERICRDLAEMKDSDGVVPDCLMITGDLAEQGQKAEMDDALAFIRGLMGHLGLPKENVFVIPGNHDINRHLSSAYHSECLGNSTQPNPICWPKYKHYNNLFNELYEGTSDIEFTEARPWTLFENKTLQIVVAGVNSTLIESHLDTTHYGWVGEDQMRWFADRLAQYRERGWLRLVAVHHNLNRVDIADDEHLRDEPLFKQIFRCVANVILHGHTHRDGLEWADNTIPILSTGSAALNRDVLPEEIPNQYQILRISGSGFERWTRRYEAEQRRWIADTRCTTDGKTGYQGRKIPFSYVSGTFPSNGEGEENGASAATEDKRIVRLDKPLDSNSARRKLESIPKITPICEPQHQMVRKEQLVQFVEILKANRSAWLVCDWGAGKDGFLGCAVAKVNETVSVPVFRLNCSGLDTPEDILRAAESQLGMSFQEFAAAVSAIPSAMLFFDDIPASFANGVHSEHFLRVVETLKDFGENLYLIFCGRSTPAKGLAFVQLKPLDESEVFVYLKNHSSAYPDLDLPNELTRITLWSGGLPMHLDRLLKRLHYIPLNQVIEEEAAGIDGNTEPVPESLKAAIAQLLSSESTHQRNSCRLLKLLTVLRDGETFESIKRFYRTPFHVSHIDELVGNGLLERVPISQTVAPFQMRATSIQRDEETPRLLRLPRSVRDYVNSILTQSERADILDASKSFFFGSKWWQGKIRLRRTILDAYGHSPIIGPGNEYLVARQLLQRAIESHNKARIEKNAIFALNYCSKLLSQDRFRDALMALQGIVPLVEQTTYTQGTAEGFEKLAHALRMMGRHDEAITYASKALELADISGTDEFRAQINLTLSLTQKALLLNDESLASAQRVLELAHNDSGEAAQAQGIIAELTLQDGALIERLTELEAKARNRRHFTAANNLALDLARRSKTPEDALQWLKRVIESSQDPYNKTRAIIERITILGSNIKASNLRDEDWRSLSAAYSYSYSQRIGNLLDRCHTSLWGLFKRSNLLASLLRLFRFSSFIWRVRGKDEMELPFLQDLEQIDFSEMEKTYGASLAHEMSYLHQRRSYRIHIININ